MASFPVNDFTEGAWKSNKNHKNHNGAGKGGERKVAEV